MARRKKIGELKDAEVECGYCGAIIPENALRCPSCGRMFSAARKVLAFAVVMIVVIAGLSYFLVSNYLPGHEGVSNGLEPPNPNGPTGNKFMVIETNRGQIKILLDTAHAPVTTAHIMDLVNSGWYKDGAWYRAVPDFVLQGGTERSSSGASSTNVNWEDTGLKNVKYSVAMARSGQQSDVNSRDTGSSEFFINLKDNVNLDSQYAYVVFGRVVSGFDVIDTIMGMPTNSQYLTNPVQFTSVSITSS